MTIPDFQSVMRPALDILSDYKVRTLRDLRDLVAERMGVTAEEREVLLPSGTQRTFDNRVGWAMSHLAAVGAVSRPSRGNYQITPRGHQLLDENSERIDLGVLDQFPELREFRGGGRRMRREAAIATLDEAATPTERIEVAVEELHDAVSAELLDRVRSIDPTDFERLVIRLMQAMGYGGAASDAARHLGRTGDNGVDGVIDEDRLGLDQVYIQAKRWAADQAVRRPDIQGFVGALEGQRASKGVFITTSRFTDDAREYARSLLRRVVLIDGDELADLMIRYGVGVQVYRTVELTRVDEDYFESGLE
jgi:restriction system protein